MGPERRLWSRSLLRSRGPQASFITAASVPGPGSLQSFLFLQTLHSKSARREEERGAVMDALVRASAANTVRARVRLPDSSALTVWLQSAAHRAVPEGPGPALIQ